MTTQEAIVICFMMFVIIVGAFYALLYSAVNEIKRVGESVRHSLSLIDNITKKAKDHIT